MVLGAWTLRAHMLIKVQSAELLGATLGAGKTEFLRAVHLYVSGEMWRPSGSRRTIIQWKKGEEKNVIDFLTVIFTQYDVSDSRGLRKRQGCLLGH